MTFTYQIDEEDFVSAGKLLLKTRRKAALRRVVVFCSLLALLASCVTFLWLHQFGSALACGFFAAVYSGLPLLVGWQYRRQFRKIPALHEPRSLEAEANGVHIISPLTDARFAWQILDRFAENERVFLLVQQGGRVFFPISKRQLSPEQIVEFRSLCAAHIPSKV